MRINPRIVFIAALFAACVSCKETPKAEPAPALTAHSPGALASGMSAPIASAPAAQGVAIDGKILETMDASSYSYFNVECSLGKVWVAVPKTKIAVGDKVAVENAMKMENFHSPTLNRTFPEIYFGTMRGGAAAAGSAMPMPAGSGAAIPENIDVAKASGANAYTVAEAIAEAEKLNGKPVVIQAVVVKVNNGIMDRNWIHVRDGSGTEKDKNNDILITTSETPAVGDVVVVHGKLSTNKDFGAGYSYKVMIEEGAFTPGTAKGAAKKK